MGDCIFFHYNFRRRVSIKLENPDWRSLEKVEAHIITTPRSGCSVYYLRKKRLKLFGYSKVSVLVACESSISSDESGSGKCDPTNGLECMFEIRIFCQSFMLCYQQVEYKLVRATLVMFREDYTESD